MLFNCSSSFNCAQQVKYRNQTICCALSSVDVLEARIRRSSVMMDFDTLVMSWNEKW